MTCHGCASKFSIFLREHTCTPCGFSFCSKCLKSRAAVDGKNLRVCNNCHVKLNSEQPSVRESSSFDSDSASTKYLDTFRTLNTSATKKFEEKRERPFPKGNAHSNENRNIYERLEKLRGKKPYNLPSEDEIKLRLNILRGKNEDSGTVKTQVPTRKLTAAEEVNQLLQKYTDEVLLGEMSDSRRSEKDLEERLKKIHLREGEKDTPGTSHKASEQSVISDSDTDTDTEVKKIVEKAIATSELEKRLNDSNSEPNSDEEVSNDESEEGSDKLPWCEICNEDAVLKCIQCSGCLYCQTCYKEGHNAFDMKGHQIVMIKK